MPVTSARRARAPSDPTVAPNMFRRFRRLDSVRRLRRRRLELTCGVSRILRRRPQRRLERLARGWRRACLPRLLERRVELRPRLARGEHQLRLPGVVARTRRLDAFPHVRDAVRDHLQQALKLRLLAIQVLEALRVHRREAVLEHRSHRASGRRRLLLLLSRRLLRRSSLRQRRSQRLDLRAVLRTHALDHLTRGRQQLSRLRRLADEPATAQRVVDLQRDHQRDHLAGIHILRRHSATEDVTGRRVECMEQAPHLSRLPSVELCADAEHAAVPKVGPALAGSLGPRADQRVVAKQHVKRVADSSARDEIRLFHALATDIEGLLDQQHVDAGPRQRLLVETLTVRPMHRRRQAREQKLRAEIAHNQVLLSISPLPVRRLDGQPRLDRLLLLLLIHHSKHRRQLVELQSAHQDHLVLVLVTSRRDVLAGIRLHKHAEVVRRVNVFRRVLVVVEVGLPDRVADVVALGQQHHRLHPLHVRAHRDQPVRQAQLLELHASQPSFFWPRLRRDHVGVADELAGAVHHASEDAVARSALELRLRDRADPLLQNLRLLRCAKRTFEQSGQLRLDVLRGRLSVVDLTRLLVVLRRDEIFDSRTPDVGVNFWLCLLTSIFPHRTGWRARRGLVDVESW